MSSPSDRSNDARVAIIAELTAKAGMRDRLIGMLMPLVDAARHEKGVDMYTIWCSSSDEDTLWSFELYSNPAAFREHADSQASQELGAEIGEMLVRAPVLHELVSAAGFKVGLP